MEAIYFRIYANDRGDEATVENQNGKYIVEVNGKYDMTKTEKELSEWLSKNKMEFIGVDKRY